MSAGDRASRLKRRIRRDRRAGTPTSTRPNGQGWNDLIAIKPTADDVRPELSRLGGETVRTMLDDKGEWRLRRLLDGWGVQPAAGSA